MFCDITFHLFLSSSCSGSSHCKCFPNRSCKKILACIVTGVISPSGSKIQEESRRTSRFVMKGASFVTILGVSESVSEDVFHCNPRIFTVSLVSALPSCFARLCS